MYKQNTKNKYTHTINLVECIRHTRVTDNKWMKVSTYIATWFLAASPISLSVSLNAT